MEKTTIREKIFDRAEEDYKKFQSSLIPGESRILGVRLPILRTLAKEIAKEDWRSHLENAQDEYFEEVMLQGMVIGYAKADWNEISQYIAAFLPKISNWALCDSFCNGLKITKKHPQEMWDFIQPFLKSEQEFEVRFAVVMMMSHYINDSYIDKILSLLPQVSHEGYYVKMGVAWAISVCFVKFPEKTLCCLKSNDLDRVTHQKSLQKIIESNRVNQETKDMIRALKRKYY